MKIQTYVPNVVSEWPKWQPAEQTENNPVAERAVRREHLDTLFQVPARFGLAACLEGVMHESSLALRRWFHLPASILTVLFLCGPLLLAGCEGFYSIGGGTCFGVTPVPVVSSVFPTPLDTHALPVTMTVTGSNFQTWSTVYWNKVSLPTSYVDSGHLQVALTAETMPELSSDGGTVEISVFTAAQGTTHVAGCTNGGFSGTILIIIH